MSYQQKDGQGSLFKNSNRKSDNAPNLTGTAMIDGKLYEIAGWTKETAKGAKWISLSIKPKRGADEAPSASQAHAIAQGGRLDREEIPF